MPDDRSLEFWKAAAAAYAGRSNVLLGLYNEPHDIPWQTWRDGKDNYAGKVLEFADQNHLSWIGWCMHPGAKPCLIKDWNYTPTAYG